MRPLVDGEPAFRRICEAIEGAHHSVWTTVTFLWATFVMPSGQGSFFDVLDRAAERGLDVCVLFWRPGEELAEWRGNAFWGSSDHLASLEEQTPRIRVRWDRGQLGFCQHQKSWLVDAGHETAVGFVGGINLNPHSVVSPGHSGEGHNHDVYVEIAGPSTVDIQRNFVQRWNEASDRTRSDGLWGNGADLNLPLPGIAPPERGSSVVQIQRTRGGLDAERTIFEQYRIAIAAARRSIYLENQAVTVPAIVTSLQEALERGVEVVVLVPGEPEPLPDTDTTRQLLDARAALGAFQNFTLAGLAGLGDDGQRKHVYVHSKLMLVDDEWATIGSCNLHAASLFGNAEINASFWDPNIVRHLRCRLFEEHLGENTEDLKDLASLRHFGQVARENRRRWDAGEATWAGIAFSFDPAVWGRAIRDD